MRVHLVCVCVCVLGGELMNVHTLRESDVHVHWQKRDTGAVCLHTCTAYILATENTSTGVSIVAIQRGVNEHAGAYVHLSPFQPTVK